MECTAYQQCGGYCLCDNSNSGCEFTCCVTCQPCQACNICNDILNIMVPWANESVILNDTDFNYTVETIWYDIDQIIELCADRPTYPCYNEQIPCQFYCDEIGDMDNFGDNQYDTTGCLDECQPCNDVELCTRMNKYLGQLDWALSITEQDEEIRQMRSDINTTLDACRALMNSGCITKYNVLTLMILSLITILFN